MKPRAGSDPSAVVDYTNTAIMVVLLAFLLNLMSRIGETFAVFLLPIESEMRWNRSTLAGIYALYMGTHGISGIFSGWFVDRVGPRIVYTAGLLLYSCAFALAQFATQPWHFFMTTGVMAGVAMTAIGMTTATVLITAWYRGPLERHLSLAISVPYAGLGAGVVLWIPTAHVLIDRLGWRSAYQWLGLGILLLAGVIYCLPWDKLARPQATRQSTAVSEINTAQPGTSLRNAMRVTTLWALFGVLFGTAVAIYAIAPQLVAYLVAAGYSLTTATMAYTVNGLLALFGIAATGWLAGRFGSRRIATLSYTLTIVGLLGLSALMNQPSLLLLWIVILPIGLSQGARGPIVSTLVSKIFPGSSLGLIHGAVTMGVGLGGMVGAWLSGVLYDLSGGYTASFALAIVAAFLSCSLFWLVRDLKTR
ncbi:MAG: MFS transporter [Pseudomonadota bacterium]|nr:MFS transporter [Pseudomonadota bacterium]